MLLMKIGGTIIMKELIKMLGDKKMSKEERMDLILDSQNDLIKYFIKDGFRPNEAETIKKLYDAIEKPKFIKALKSIIKKVPDELSRGYAVILYGYVQSHQNDKDKVMYSDEESVIEVFAQMISSILKKDVKRIAKKTNIPVSVVTEILVIAPSLEYISSVNVLGIYSQRMMQKLYRATGDDVQITTKALTKLFGMIFDKANLNAVAINALLERKDNVTHLTEAQRTIWNTVTDWALGIIEGLDKEVMIKTLKEYYRRRNKDAKNDKNKRGGDSPRRVNLAQLPEEDYPKIRKAIKKLLKNEDCDASYFN